MSSKEKDEGSTRRYETAWNYVKKNVTNIKYTVILLFKKQNSEMPPEKNCFCLCLKMPQNFSVSLSI